MNEETVKITYKGKTVVLRKRDVGPEREEDRQRRLTALQRDIDMRPVAKQLGFSTEGEDE